jgi:hypothetical protein
VGDDVSGRVPDPVEQAPRDEEAVEDGRVVLRRVDEKASSAPAVSGRVASRREGRRGHFFTCVSGTNLVV